MNITLKYVLIYYLDLQYYYKYGFEKEKSKISVIFYHKFRMMFEFVTMDYKSNREKIREREQINMKKKNKFLL